MHDAAYIRDANFAQGLMLVESCLPEGTVELGEQKDRWTLSEDPDDQKDSLWILSLIHI